ncbi:immunity 52 family protein [Oxalobacteraceae bacterium]|nr:immunity 52 family protein [Oxalobacteraceae bacterium]
MSFHLTISANFRTGASLPSIDDQYNDLWKIAKSLETAGLPLDGWFPPADSEANSLLNNAFVPTGPSPAALAMAKADKSNLATDLRTLGVWNGEENEGAIVYTATYNTGRIPSHFDFSADEVPAFMDYRNVVNLVQTLIRLWRPMLVKIAPGGYAGKNVFPDRPPVGWMIYLPFEIDSKQVPEAAVILPILDEHDNKQRLGTLIVSVAETFDPNNPEHVKKANAIETRLVDQDLLPTLREFVTRF